MTGLMIFKNLAEAVRAGFEVYGRTPEGYLVRTYTDRGWALALVIPE